MMRVVFKKNQKNPWSVCEVVLVPYVDVVVAVTVTCVRFVLDVCCVKHN